MNKLLRLWILGIYSPSLVFKTLKSSIVNSTRFTWWTSFLIYCIGYFSLLSVVFGFNVVHLGGFMFLIILFLLITFSMLKNYCYTLMLSYRLNTLVSYQEVCLISAISDTPLLVIYPLLYVLSSWIDGSFLVVFMIILSIYLLKQRSRMFSLIYETSGKFVYTISATLVFTLIALFIFFFLYLGISIKLFISALLS